MSFWCIIKFQLSFMLLSHWTLADSIRCVAKQESHAAAQEGFSAPAVVAFARTSAICQFWQIGLWPPASGLYELAAQPERDLRQSSEWKNVPDATR